MQNTEKTPIEETPGFIAAWNAPITKRPAPGPAPVEPPGFLAAWEAPITKRPARTMSEREAQILEHPWYTVECTDPNNDAYWQ